MSSPATPSEIEVQQVIPIEKIKGPFVYRASNNGTPVQGPYGYVLDWTEVHLGLYRHLARNEEGQDNSSHELDHHALLQMARDIHTKLSNDKDAFPSDEVYDYDLDDPGSRFSNEGNHHTRFLAEQLRYFEWETSQWTLLQANRQNQVDEDQSRPELCRAYYRWLIDSLERHDELVKSEPLRINKILQRKLAWNLKGEYLELLSDERDPPPPPDTPTHSPPSSPTPARATPAPQPPDAPQPPVAPAALSNPDRSKNQNHVNSLQDATGNTEPLPEPEIQQQTRPAKRKRATCALTRELRSLAQLGGPGNALVGRAVVIEPGNADQHERQENGPDAAGWGRRLRRRLNGRVALPGS